MRLKTKAQHQIVPSGQKERERKEREGQGRECASVGAVPLWAWRGRIRLSADRTFSPTNAYRKELRDFFCLLLFFDSRKRGEKIVD